MSWKDQLFQCWLVCFLCLSVSLSPPLSPLSPPLILSFSLSQWKRFSLFFFVLKNWNPGNVQCYFRGFGRISFPFFPLAAWIWIEIKKKIWLNRFISWTTGFCLQSVTIFNYHLFSSNSPVWWFDRKWSTFDYFETVCGKLINNFLAKPCIVRNLWSRLIDKWIKKRVN